MSDVTISPQLVEIMWSVIDRLPGNLYDFDRDPFGFANLLQTCGVEIEPLSGPFDVITVRRP